MKNKSILRLIPLLILIAVFSAFALVSCRGDGSSGTVSGSLSDNKSVVNELNDPASESAASATVADPEWESKITAGVFDSEIYENGKYLVIVFLSDPPSGTDCKSRNDAFLKRYGIEAKDVVYIGDYTATVIIYAPRELIEEIAKDRDTVLIDSFVNDRPVNM